MCEISPRKSHEKSISSNLVYIFLFWDINPLFPPRKIPGYAPGTHNTKDNSYLLFEVVQGVPSWTFEQLTLKNRKFFFCSIFQVDFNTKKYLIYGMLHLTIHIKLHPPQKYIRKLHPPQKYSTTLPQEFKPESLKTPFTY